MPTRDSGHQWTILARLHDLGPMTRRVTTGPKMARMTIAEKKLLRSVRGVYDWHLLQDVFALLGAKLEAFTRLRPRIIGHTLEVQQRLELQHVLNTGKKASPEEFGSLTIEYLLKPLVSAASSTLRAISLGGLMQLFRSIRRSTCLTRVGMF